MTAQASPRSRDWEAAALKAAAAAAQNDIDDDGNDENEDEDDEAEQEYRSLARPKAPIDAVEFQCAAVDECGSRHHLSTFGLRARKLLKKRLICASGTPFMNKIKDIKRILTILSQVRRTICQRPQEEVCSSYRT